MPTAEPKHPILTDRPANRDGLDFQPYIDSLAELIIDPAASTPLTLGVFGRWGSGKTTLMQLIKQQVDDKGYKTVWFNAWKYERESLALWRVLILRTLDALRPRRADGEPYKLEELPDPQQKALVQELDRLEQSVYRAVEWTELGKWTVDWVKALEGTVEGAAEIALSLLPGAGPLVNLLRQARNAAKGEDIAPIADAFRREAQAYRREQLASIEQFVDTFEQTIRQHLVAQGGRLVVFVDDLDRCLPERTVEVLEAIKLFLDVPGCIFVLGVDPDKVQQGIRLRYSNLSAEEGVDYLQKIIQVPFILPDIEAQDMRHFVEQLQVAFPDPRCGEVFSLGLEPNPRQIKRAINVYLLLWKLAGKRRLKIDPAAGGAPTSGPLLKDVLTSLRLAKVVVIQHSYPALYTLLKLTPRYLRDLEAYFIEAEVEAEAKAEGEERKVARRELPGPLEPFAQHAGLRRLFRLFPGQDDACFRSLTPTHLRLYLTLAGRAESEQPTAPAPPRSRSRLTFEPELVQIPAGDFLMGSTEEEVKQGLVRENETPQHNLSLPAFEIGRYPVTNLEYKAFVKATGHEPPRHWEGGKFPGELADHPVVFVTWHDAVAYCQWLSETTGKSYRLPSEAEWEYAARGSDGRRYPWGNEFDKGKCNTQEAGIGATTPVGQYSPAGDSPFGCADMAGNVWEWTASEFEAYQGSNYRDEYYGKGLRVVRGGAFANRASAARAAVRYGNYPINWDGYYGFRVVGVAAPSSPPLAVSVGAGSASS